MSEVVFEAGDVVTCVFYGDEEFVLKESNNSVYPVCISMNKDSRSFTENGKYHLSDTAPVLKLVRKKTKEREFVQVFRVACDNESFYLGKNEFDSYEDVFTWIRRNGIPSWEYKIEKVYKVKE